MSRQSIQNNIGSYAMTRRNDTRQIAEQRELALKVASLEKAAQDTAFADKLLAMQTKLDQQIECNDLKLKDAMRLITEERDQLVLNNQVEMKALALKRKKEKATRKALEKELSAAKAKEE